MLPNPLLARELAAGRAADLIARGGGRRDAGRVPRRRGGARWRSAVGWRLVALGGRVLGDPATTAIAQAEGRIP
jgi:hypothetical protein